MTLWDYEAKLQVWYIMKMKKSLKLILVYILISYFVLNMFNQGIELPLNSAYLFLTLVIISFVLLIACPLLNFLTIKCKFLTFFLMSFLLLTGTFYALKLFMVGFFIETYTFEGLDLGSLQINTFEVIPIISIILFSLSISFLSALFRELDSSKIS